MEQPKSELAKSNWYDKWYKLLMLIPISLMIISLVYLGIFFSQNNDIMIRDSSLSGGTIVTVHGEVDDLKLESDLKKEIPDISVRKLTDVISGQTVATIIESSMTDSKLFVSEIENSLGYNLTTGENGNSNIESTGPTLSKGFYKQLLFALFISFVLMSIVIFILFRSFIPSVAVIFAAFSNIVIPLSIINFFGVRLSAAGIAAFLMLIGYSVDTDILLTTRVLKNREGSVNKRILGAFKTGIFMTLAALAAVLPAFFIVSGLPDSFRQIFLILSLGLSADILNTWLTNAGILKWYCKRKGIE